MRIRKVRAFVGYHESGWLALIFCEPYSVESITTGLDEGKKKCEDARCVHVLDQQLIRYKTCTEDSRGRIHLPLHILCTDEKECTSFFAFLT